MTSILDRIAVFTTPWFSLIEKRVRTGDEEQLFYAIAAADYVCVVPITAAGKIVLVRQYRPAIESDAVELPSGHVDAGETPEAAAARELLEETGFRAESMELTGCLSSDVGRLSNRQWCFRAKVIPTDSLPEHGVEVLLVTRVRLREMIASGDFSHAPHVAAIYLALAADAI